MYIVQSFFYIKKMVKKQAEAEHFKYMHCDNSQQ